MATAMIYDTLKLAEDLERDAGFEAARAKALARILAGNTGGNLATEDGLRATRDDLQARMQAVKSDLESQIQSLRTELQSQIQSLRGDVRLLRWMIGTTLAGVAALMGIALSLAVHVLRLG